MKLPILALAFASLLSVLASAQVPDQLKRSIPALGYKVAVGGGYVAVTTADYISEDLVRAVRIFDLATGALLFVLPNPGPADDGSFGNSVAISGSRVVVGADENDTGKRNAGVAFVYDLASATPTVPALTLNNPSPVVNGSFGFSVAISGTRVVVGAYLNFSGNSYAGRAYVYDLGSATPSLPIANLDNPASSSFGHSVAISGMRVAVGAYGDNTGAAGAGSAYVYDLASATPAAPVVTLHNPAPAEQDYFGASVAVSGTRVVVGAARDDAGAGRYGSAYLYDMSGGAPTVPVAILGNPNPGGSYHFGVWTGISGSRIVVGSPNTIGGSTGSGTAYVYDTGSATPGLPVATLASPSPSLSDNFGLAVAIDGATIVIGAPNDDTAGIDQGATFIYGPSPYSLWKVSELSDQFAPDLGDADGDGLSNLGEYGLLRSPIFPNGAATTAAPALYADGERLRVFVPRDPARNDATLEVQATGDLLGPWTTIATSTLGAPFTGPGYFAGDSATPGVKQVEVRDTVNLPDAPKRFMRVRVRH